MCYGTETLYIGAALAAAGAATSSYAQSQQLKKQDQIAAQGIIKQGQLQKQGEGDVGATIGQVAKSNATTQATAANQLAQYRAALQQGSTNSGSASPGVPGASKAYKGEQAVAGASAKNYTDAIASSAATTEGTQLERVGENQAMADTAGKLGILSGQSQSQNYLTKLQVQSTKANPWLTGLGTVLSAAGSGYAGAAITAGSAATRAKQAAGSNIDTGYLSGTTPISAGSVDPGTFQPLTAEQNPWG